MAQIDRIAAAQVSRLKLPSCGHAPHRDAPAAVSAAIARFVLGAAG
jgi:pimeloyl-ACP methyl ester carboxylesterase